MSVCLQFFCVRSSPFLSDLKRRKSHRHITQCCRSSSNAIKNGFLENGCPSQLGRRSTKTHWKLFSQGLRSCRTILKSSSLIVFPLLFISMNELLAQTRASDKSSAPSMQFLSHMMNVTSSTLGRAYTDDEVSKHWSYWAILISEECLVAVQKSDWRADGGLWDDIYKYERDAICIKVRNLKRFSSNLGTLLAGSKSRRWVEALPRSWSTAGCYTAEHRWTAIHGSGAERNNEVFEITDPRSIAQECSKGCIPSVSMWWENLRCRCDSKSKSLFQKG